MEKDRQWSEKWKNLPQTFRSVAPTDTFLMGREKEESKDSCKSLSDLANLNEIREELFFIPFYLRLVFQFFFIV